MERATVIVKEVIDERGRFIRPQEFRWLMDYFKDRYDPRRLALALCYCAGLRVFDACRVSREHFSQDFSYLSMRQCKASIKVKDGITRVRIKPRNMPLPTWLTADLKAYVEYRAKLGAYQQFGEVKRLFPLLKTHQVQQWFQKLRLREGDAQPWLREAWYKEQRFSADGRQLRSFFKYRVAPHAGRAMHAIAAKTVCEGDLAAARLITGHERTKDIERYTRFAEASKLKQEVTERFMEPLVSRQPTPLSQDQRTLRHFGITWSVSGHPGT